MMMLTNKQQHVVRILSQLTSRAVRKHVWVFRKWLKLIASACLHASYTFCAYSLARGSNSRLDTYPVCCATPTVSKCFGVIQLNTSFDVNANGLNKIEIHSDNIILPVRCTESITTSTYNKFTIIYFELRLAWTPPCLVFSYSEIRAVWLPGFGMFKKQYLKFYFDAIFTSLPNQHTWINCVS